MSLLLNILLSILPFGSPVHVPVQLAGNFGEPRPNHFHGGIDIKTEREVNLGVYSIADGYIQAPSLRNMAMDELSWSLTPMDIPVVMFISIASHHRLKLPYVNGNTSINSLLVTLNSDQENSL